MKKKLSAALALGVVLGFPAAMEVRPSREYVVAAGPKEQILARLRAFYGQRPRPWRPHALDSRHRHRALNRQARAANKRITNQKGRTQ